MMELNKAKSFKVKGFKQKILVSENDGFYELTLILQSNSETKIFTFDEISYMDITHLINALKEARELIETK